MPARMLMACYVAWMAMLGTAFFLAPGGNNLIWTAIGLSSSAALVVGTVHNQPRRRTPWVLLAAAVLAFCAGDTAYNVLTDLLGQRNPFPSVADVLYLVMITLWILGVLGLARSGSTGRDRAGLLDSLTLTLGLGLLSWIFLIEPYVHDPTLTVLERAVSIGYPLSDVLILATLIRLLVSIHRTVMAVILLTVGAAGMLVADVLYGLSQLNGTWSVGGPVDLGWFMYYALWGAAALHPSMTQLTEPRIIRQNEVSYRRLTLLTLSSLIAPAVLLVEDLQGEVRDAAVIAVLSALLFLLVLARLSVVANIHSQAVARERGLRQAGAALVSATDTAGVTSAVRTAVAHLLPANADHRVVLALTHSTDAEQAEAEVAVPGRHPQSVIAGTLTSDSAPVTVLNGRVGPTSTPPPSTQVTSATPRTAEHPTRLVNRRSLDPAVARELGEFSAVLMCPLALEDQRVSDPRAGTLFVAAAKAALAALPGALDVLASQAALALERIALSTEIARRNSEEYFRTLVQNTADVILIVNVDGRIRYASPSAMTLFGVRSLTGVSLETVIHPDDRAQASQILEQNPAGDDPHSPTDWNVLGANGGPVQVEVLRRDLRHDPTVHGLVITLRDVTERRRLERELTYRAYHDALTGLANRVLFHDRVKAAVDRSHRHGTLVGVLFIDLDDFKIVNDTMGHHVGDELLFAVGQRLAASLRPEDTPARLGGDEFAALIDNISDPGEVEQIAERVVKALAEPFLVGEDLVSGVASAGIATTADATDNEELLRQADLALYVAKGAGKGQWRRYQAALHTAIRERLELRAALDQVVADGAFMLHYQPILELTSGTVTGFEALVRWNHPVRGMVEPDEFIGVAEESGLIVPIGYWVLEHAMADAVAWQRAVPRAGKPSLSLNVSARQFRTPGFPERVRRELAISGLAPGSLMLEITESLLLRDDEQVRGDLTALRHLGVRIAIDDFGTGYSSLSRLRQVPVDVLKIDRSFIDMMAASARQQALVESIVRLAHTLGLQVVAEGIEDPADHELLQEMGCAFGQGYLFSKPLSYGEAVQWLRTELPNS